MKNLIASILILISSQLKAQNYNFVSFEVIPIKAKFDMKISDQKLHRYTEDSDSRAENDEGFSEILREIIASDTSNKPLFRFEWQSGDFKYSILKYQKKDLSKQLKLYTLQDNWNEIVNPSKDNEKLFYNVFKVMTLELYDLLTSNSELSANEEIENIKAKYSSPEGILDIDKLGAYLATKPKELEKYCDF